MKASIGSAVFETERALEAIEQHNPRVNAILTVDAGAALKQARAADRAAEAGDWLGLLHGLPTTVKDCLNVAGYRTTFGSRAFRDNVAQDDSEAVRRFVAAGSVIVGKTNLSEFCYGLTNENPHYGNCRNPWDLDRIPGGSSGGSAASVAAGMCRISWGSDTGGSVRVPAALCGVVGLRPTIGRVPNTGALEASAQFDVIGPMAYAVSDVARAFAAVAGYDPADHQSVDQPVPNFLPALRDGLSGVRIGLPRRFFFEDCQSEVEARALAAGSALERAGAHLVDVDVPNAEDAQAHTMSSIILADMADAHRGRMEEQPDTIGPEVLRRLRLGVPIKGMDYARSLRWLLKWKVCWRRLFDTVDLILTPTTPRTAPGLVDAADMIAASQIMSRNTFGVGTVGLPAISLPCGFDGQGLPIGVQLAAKWLDEPLLLRAGVAYQAQTEFHRSRPRF